jgi:predicted RNA-binding Zn ribbon-like protein
MGENKSGVETLALLGGALCLDFANTIGNHKGAKPSEHLVSYADLVAWSRRAGILTNRAAQELLSQAARHPSEASDVLQRARTLREAIYRIFSAIAAGASAKSADLKILNRSLGDALVNSRLVPTKNGFAWGWADETTLDQMLGVVARSAADLLTLGKLDRVRQCSDEVCGWLFVDTSKSRSRRWCDMNDCGNRAKARRYYRRIRGIK